MSDRRSVTARREDRGSAAIWVLTCGALLMVVAAVALVQGLAVVARHEAESAADLAALAGAGRIGTGADPCAAARRIALRNGARVSRCEPAVDASGRTGTVVVEVTREVRLPIVGVRQVSAGARAGRLPAHGPTT